MSWQEWAMDANMYDGEDEDYAETYCPNCGEGLTLDGHMAELVRCPNCGKEFEPFPEPDPEPDYGALSALQWSD